MSCSIAKAELKQNLSSKLKELAGELDTITAEGSSTKLSKAVLTQLSKYINDPSKAASFLEKRKAVSESLLHKHMMKQLGEEITIDGKPHFIMETRAAKNKDIDGGIEVTLVVSEPKDITDYKTYKFSISNDTSMSHPDVFIEGLSTKLQKGVLGYVNQVRASKETEVKIVDNGNKELRQSLQALVEANKIMFSVAPEVSERSFIGYERVPDYKHGDVESMKGILSRLHVLGDRKATRKQLAYYRDLLDQLHPRFFNEMQLFLKKNGAEPLSRVPLNRKQIYIQTSKEQANRSEAETYVHAVIKSMVSWGLTQNHSSITKVRMQLNNLLSEVQKQLKWQDFLNKPEDTATFREKEAAKKLYEDIFTGEDVHADFIAYALTNETLMKKTQAMKTKDKKEPKTFFEKIMSFFTTLMDIVAGRFEFGGENKLVFDRIHDLAFALAEVNNEHLGKLDQLNFMGKIMEALENTDEFLSTKMRKGFEKLENTKKRIELPPEDATLWEKAKFMVELGWGVMTNPLYRGFMGLVASASWGLRPGGWVREVVGGFLERDVPFRIAERLNLEKQRSDALRNGDIDANASQLKKLFKQELTQEEHAAVKHYFLDTGLTALKFKRNNRSKYSDKKIIELLTSNNARISQYKKLAKELQRYTKEDTRRQNWYEAQAEALARYLVYGQGTRSLNLNADNIAKGYGLPAHYKYDANISNLIEEMVIIKALSLAKEGKDKEMKIVAELIKSETKGMNAIADSHKALWENSKTFNFDNNTAHMVMGYTKDLSDATIDITVAPVSKRLELEAEGFELKKILVPDAHDKYSSQMGLFVTSVWGRKERMSGVVGLGHFHAKGTNISHLKRLDDPILGSTAFARDLARINISALQEHNNMMEGTHKFGEDTVSIAPVYSRSGEVTDYRYMMDKTTKEELLKQDLDIFQIMSRSNADVKYQVRKKELNQKAWEFITADMAENWKEGNVGTDGFTEYHIIGPNVADDKMKELFLALPEEFREKIVRSTSKQIAVRQDLMDIMFGYAHPQLTDAPIIRMFPKEIKRIVDMIEGVWMEFVKISKTSILLKMPKVIVSNLISNILYAINTGNYNPIELFRNYADSIREVNDYINLNRKKTALEQEILRDKEALNRVRNSEVLNEKLRRKEIQLASITKQLATNPAAELFEQGMYQSYIEDVGRTAIEDNNRLTQGIENQLKKAPKVVQHVANWTYLTHNTIWYKGMQEILQRSDMVARLVEQKRRLKEEEQMVAGNKKLPRWWTKHKEEQYKEENLIASELRSTPYEYPQKKRLVGKEKEEFLAMSKENRRQALLDNYINYTLPNSPMEEYLNRMGVLMFTKYLKRIQRIIGQAAVNKPLTTALLMLAAHGLYDADKIQDQAFLYKGFRYGDFSLTNIVPVYSPIFHLQNVFTPPLVRN